MNATRNEPFGDCLGIAPGQVKAYSSDYDTASEVDYPRRSDYRSYFDGIYMGYKWQCVEFARRWLYVNCHYIFDDVAMAFDIFNLRSVRDVRSNRLLPFHAFRNGSKKAPSFGDLLIWAEGGEFKRTGHVAVITEVSENFVRIAEQNEGHIRWPKGQNYARELQAKVSSGGEFWITCSYGDAEILGWMKQTNDDEFAEPTPVKNDRLSLIKTAHAEENSNLKKAWLNIANNDEAAFVEMMGGHCLTQNSKEHTRFFMLSETAANELEHATNELHGLFMHATDYVLAHDDILESFNLPVSILPKIRKSWDNRLNELITSRFDFSLTKQGIKVYEYNCDSASCYMEAGKVQGKWAKSYNVKVGRDAGENLFKELVKAWKKSHATHLVHILCDDDPEEKYHALFMQSALRAAGVTTKMIVNFDSLSWNETGDILDSEGEHIQWIWKTWAWETALDQIRDETDENVFNRNSSQANSRVSKAIRLSDVLLHPKIMVYEPLWSLIPSNKAILPVLWRLFPNHPLLLNTALELNEQLKATGYVVKPIVGRCGENITLYDQQNNLLETTPGSFERQDSIYQQLYPLPNIDDYYVQVCTFTAAGKFAGSGVRVDKSMVINKDSDCIPLRIVDDYYFTEK